MAKRGPKASRIAARTDSRAASNNTEAGGTLTDIEKPADLSEPEAQVWDELVPYLLRKRFLDTTDYAALRMVIGAVAEERERRVAFYEMASKGEVTEYDRNGVAHVVPFYGSKVEKRIRAGWHSARNQARLLLSEVFGTPAARASVEAGSSAEGFVQTLQRIFGDEKGDK